jgi:hypothetical protein
MEASMQAFAIEVRGEHGRPTRKRASGHNAQDSIVRKAAAHRRYVERNGAAARAEHALFAVVLCCVGYVWLGALIAEAVRGL